MRFCEYKGYTFNPKELRNPSDGRISGVVNGKSTEMIYLKSNPQIGSFIPNEIPFSTIDSDEKPY